MKALCGQTSGVADVLAGQVGTDVSREKNIFHSSIFIPHDPYVLCYASLFSFHLVSDPDPHESASGFKVLEQPW